MKRFLSLILSVCIVFSCLGIVTYAASESDLTFTLNSDGESYTLSSCKESAEGEMVIPSHYGDFPVTSIGMNAFEFCTKITSVTIPDTVKIISPFAFPYCRNLLSVTIPDSVESIGDFAFDGDFQLAVINIGSGLKTLSEFAFDNCYGLREINVSENNGIISSVDGVLFDKTKTSLIKYPVANPRTSYVVPEGVERICQNAFNSSNILKSVTLPSSLLTIEDNAFYSCSKLQSIVIPDKVTYVGYFSFFECRALADITIGKSVETLGETAFEMCENIRSMNVSEGNKLYASVDGVLFDSEKTTLLKYPVAKETENYVIPEGVQTISENAFLSCDFVKNVSIPDSVTSIGMKAFCGCSALESVSLGTGITSIGKMAFANSGLKSIVIPDNVVSIGSMAFQSSFGLESAHIGEKAEIGSNAFKGCESLASFTVSEANEYYSAIDGVIFSKDKSTLLVFPWGHKQNPYVVPAGVKTIGASAFDCCYTLRSIEISEDVETIEKRAFAVCESLDSIVFTKGLKKIASNAFSNTYVGSIFYTGTEEEWTNISIDEYGNEIITETNKHFGTKSHTPSDWILDNPPCIDGTKHNECVVCGRFLETTAQKATEGHIPSEWKVGAAATVNSQGYNYKECTLCGTVIEKSATKQLVPSTPSKLSAKLSSAGVTVSWGSVKGADSYVVYRKVKGGSWANIGTSKTTSFSDSKGTTGKTYIYTVRAVNEAGRSGYNKTGVSIKYIGAPAITSLYNAASSITVKWSKVGGVDGYYVYRKLSGANSWSKIATVKGNKIFSYVDKKALQGKTYVYTVRAYKGKTLSGYNTTGVSLTRLLTPSLLSVGNTEGGTIIKWGKVTGAKSYVVYRKTAKSVWSQVGTTSSLSYTDKSGKSGTTYYYTVRAQGTAGKSSYNTKGLSVKYIATPVLKSIENQAGGVKVTWSASGGATGYIIYRKTTAANSKYARIAVVSGGKKVSYKDTTAKSGTKYIYTVKAYSEKIYSGYTAKGVSITYLSVPVLSSVKQTNAGIVFKWKAVSGAQGYYVYRKGSDNTWTKIGDATGAKTLTFTDEFFSDGEKYTYTVRAHKGSDRSYYDTKGLSVTV